MDKLCSAANMFLFMFRMANRQLLSYDRYQKNVITPVAEAAGRGLMLSTADSAGVLSGLSSANHVRIECRYLH